MKVAPDQAAVLIKRIEQILSYEPRIGLFGKTGAGKSSLWNALFGSEVSAISDVAACTRNPQEIFVQVGSAGVKLIDCPGIGESQERDAEYRQLYKKLLPELDVVLWLVKADDRALSSDEEFFMLSLAFQWSFRLYYWDVQKLQLNVLPSVSSIKHTISRTCFIWK